MSNEPTPDQAMSSVDRIAEQSARITKQLLDLGSAYHNALVARDRIIDDLQAKLDAATKPPTPAKPARPLGIGDDRYGLRFDDLTALSKRTGYHWNAEQSTNEGNNEDQLYLRRNVEESVAGPKMIGLFAKREPVKLTAYTRKDKRVDFPFTSGAVNTAGLYEATRGFWEIEAKLPKGDGLWSGIWLLSKETWPPEIDIAEHLGHEASGYYINAHKRDGNGTKQYGPGKIQNVDYEQFHTYGVDVHDKGIDFYLDGKLAARVTDTAYLPTKPVHLMINLAVNGAWPAYAKRLVNAETKFPAVMEVRAVRIWALK